MINPHKRKPCKNLDKTIHTQSGLKLTSHNVNGINKLNKEQTYINRYIVLGVDIICLIHVRLEQQKLTQIENRYKKNYDAILNSNTKRGILILINNRKDIKWEETYRTPDGNLILLKIKFDNQTFQILAIYGPNEDNEPFYDDILSLLTANPHEQVIWIGDFNLILDYQKQAINYLTRPNPKASQKVNKIISQLGLVDVFTHMQLPSPHITWTSFKHENHDLREHYKLNNIHHPSPLKQQSKLDHCLVSPNLAPHISSFHLGDNITSDHSSLNLTIDFSNFEQAPKQFKFNEKDLTNSTYRNNLDSLIDLEVCKFTHYTGNKSMYDAPNSIKYTFLEKLNYSKLKFKRKTMTYTQLVYNILAQVTQYTNTYHDNLNKTQAKELRLLYRQQDELHQKLQRQPQNPDEQLQYDLLSEQITTKTTQYTQNKNFTTYIQAKAEGERVNTYLSASAKQNNGSRYISKLKDTDATGRTHYTTQPAKVLEKISTYYQDLYSTKSSHTTGKIKKFLGKLSLKKLTPQQANHLERPITLDEVTKVLKKTKKKSAPGLDGYTYGFFKKYWHKLAHIVMGLINEIHETGDMPDWLRMGVISLIPKGDKDRHELKNWRPLVLLNCLYKIISGTIAGRINQVLPSLISERQNGFVPGRCISDSLRNTADIIEYLNRKKIKGLLLLIDFKKAFDSIEHEYLRSIMKAYGFGDYIRKWVDILLNKFRLCTSNGGHKSSFFDMQRGCRQGDPISSALFILAIEALSLKLNNAGLQGINIHRTRKAQIDSLFADDITLLLNRDSNELRRAITILQEFKAVSGLEIQPEKTVAVPVGPDDNERYCNDIKLEWNTNFKLLGINFDNKLLEMDNNVKTRIDDIQEAYQHWLYKHMSPIGRNNVAKTYMLSKVNHLAFTYIIPPKYITEIEEVIYKYIWHNKARECKAEVQAPYQEGGLAFPKLDITLKAFQLSWTRKIYNKRHSTETTWINILDTNLQETGLSLESFLDAGDIQLTRITHLIKNPFWKSYFSNLQHFFKLMQPNDINIFMNSNLWKNTIFHDNKHPLNPHYNYPAISRIINYPKDLLTTHKGKYIFSTIAKLTRTYNLTTEGVKHITSLRNHIITLMKSLSLSLDNYKHNSQLTAIGVIATLQKKGCNKYAKLLLKHDTKHKRELNQALNHRIEQWNKFLNNRQLPPMTMDILLKMNTNLLTLKCQMYYRHIQHKINKGTLKTNKLIKHVGDGSCTFCHNESETIPHLFWLCPVTANFLKLSTRALGSIWPCKLDNNNMSLLNFIFGLPESWHSPFNFTTTIIKQYIWDCRKKGTPPILPRFLNYFKYEMSEWYHAEIAVDSEVALTFLRHPPYKNVCINWKNT